MGIRGFSCWERRPLSRQRQRGELGGRKTDLSGLPDEELWRFPGIEILRTVLTSVKV